MAGKSVKRGWGLDDALAMLPDPDQSHSRTSILELSGLQVSRGVVLRTWSAGWRVGQSGCFSHFFLSLTTWRFVGAGHAAQPDWGRRWEVRSGSGSGGVTRKAPNFYYSSIRHYINYVASSEEVICHFTPNISFPMIAGVPEWKRGSGN